MDITYRVQDVSVSNRLVVLETYPMPATSSLDPVSTFVGYMPGCVTDSEPGHFAQQSDGTMGHRP